MADLILSKVNSVYVKLTAEKYILRELSDHFTFFVPGYKFSPKFRNKIWDGKIRLLNLSTRQTYAGLVPYIEEFCEDRGYTFDYENPELHLQDEFSGYHADKFFDSLNLSAHGVKINVEEHQKSAFIHSLQNKRSLLLSPTSSGKSLIIYLLFRQLLDYQGLKGLLIVPRVDLVNQMYSDFKDYSTINGFDVEENVHKIYQGVDKNSNKNLYITTWQSVFQLPQEYFEQFDYVIGDEAHEFKANSLVDILTKCVNTKYRIGLTGTLDGSKTNKLVIEGLFGKVKTVTTTKELIDNDKISDLDIKCIVLKHPKEHCFKRDYREEIEYLIASESRNKFIRNLALSLNKNTLILFQMVDKHGKILYNLIKNAEKIGDRKVFFIHGKVEKEDREAIRIIMETEKDAIIIASYGTFSTGISIRNLFNVIYASPSKSRIRNLQSIGRGLRKHQDKDKATLYDISDDLRTKSRMNHTLKHFVERVKIYTEQKFNYKIYKIGLK